MPVDPALAALSDEMTAWRHHLHAHPETAFEETDTAAFLCRLLTGFGLEVHQGLAGTGVVATLRGDGPRAIGLRADMDALHITERTGAAHASVHPGRMHACGHDGHMAMLLGAARHLSGPQAPKLGGSVHFIFQPAEENEGGGRRMVEDGLFDAFPVDAVFGMHNWPALPLGTIGVRPGPVMAAYDIFEVALTGRGGHAAMPHQGRDPVLAAAHLVTALQTIAARLTDPQQPAVVSVTQIHGGEAWNVIPDRVVLGGTCRALSPAVHDALEPAVRRIVSGVAAAMEVEAEVRYERRYPPTVNEEGATRLCAAVAADLVGAGNVIADAPASMGSEDFSFMLAERPGCYVWLGTAGADGAAAPLHNPGFDFNDAALPLGASYWVRLAEQALS